MDPENAISYGSLPMLPPLRSLIAGLQLTL
jgi:hypothetical protein